MRKGITDSGFAFEFDEANADDMRLVDAISVTMSDEATSFETVAAAGRVAELLLGKKQKAALYAHIGKTHNGRVPGVALIDELRDIMMSGSDAEKNS